MKALEFTKKKKKKKVIFCPQRAPQIILIGCQDFSRASSSTLWIQLVKFNYIPKSAVKFCLRLMM